MKLASLSLNELEAIQKKVNREIQKRRSKAQEEGLRKIKLIAAEYGLTSNELKGISSTKRSAATKRSRKSGDLWLRSTAIRVTRKIRGLDVVVNQNGLRHF